VNGADIDKVFDAGGEVMSTRLRGRRGLAKKSLDGARGVRILGREGGTGAPSDQRNWFVKAHSSFWPCLPPREDLRRRKAGTASRIDRSNARQKEAHRYWSANMRTDELTRRARPLEGHPSREAAPTGGLESVTMYPMTRIRASGAAAFRICGGRRGLPRRSCCRGQLAL